MTPKALSREIKFRCWDKKSKALVYQDTHTFMFNKFGFNVEQYNSYSDYDGLMAVSEPVVMQFTGLHDKNGKEIYEGDIIKYEWRDFSNEIKIEPYWFHDWIEYGSEPLEVIGNIYENPELIN